MPAYASSHGQQSGNLTPIGQGRGQPHQARADSSHTTKQVDEMAAGIRSRFQPHNEIKAFRRRAGHLNRRVIL
eukprot:2952584-Pleurochrysis_carterae.AAC.1